MPARAIARCYVEDREVIVDAALASDDMSCQLSERPVFSYVHAQLKCKIPPEKPRHVRVNHRLMLAAKAYSNRTRDILTHAGKPQKLKIAAGFLRRCRHNGGKANKSFGTLAVETERPQDSSQFLPTSSFDVFPTPKSREEASPELRNGLGSSLL